MRKHWRTFSIVLYIATVYSNYTRTLTFQNLCQRQNSGARMPAPCATPKRARRSSRTQLRTCTTSHHSLLVQQQPNPHRHQQTSPKNQIQMKRRQTAFKNKDKAWPVFSAALLPWGAKTGKQSPKVSLYSQVLLYLLYSNYIVNIAGY
jgi:hypothetical protein